MKKTLHAHDAEAPECRLPDSNMFFIIVMQCRLGGIDYCRHRDQHDKIHTCDAAQQLAVERSQKYISHRTGVQWMIIDVFPA
jgi:hypothetical protein